MKRMWLIVCGLGVAFVIATALAADKKPETPPALQPNVTELKKEIASLQDKVKALEDKVNKLENEKKAPVFLAKPPTVHLLPNVQSEPVLPDNEAPLSGEFANPQHPPRIWGEGECNGWKYYVIPLSCEAARN